MPHTTLEDIRGLYLADESQLVRQLVEAAGLDADARTAIAARGAEFVRLVREQSEPSLMEAFLSEYGLSSEEGVALMCLAEALLRVPDHDTVDDLIADKLTGSDWDTHSGQASSVLVNASTWALMLTGRVLSTNEDAGVLSSLHGLIRRVGEPVIRTFVSAAMKELGEQFVLGQSIASAQSAAQRWAARGCTFSYDMLGEGARTDADARRYHLAYADAITEIAKGAGDRVETNPGISVKLSALHPRFEATHNARYADTLLARTRSLAVLAAGSNLGFNIDAEEADRLEPTLALIAELLREPALSDWEGLGVVVQAYGRRAGAVLDWLDEQAKQTGRRIMVRLVKGAYWDTEIKRGQVLGLASYPVFTRKAHTDVSYLACARKLLRAADRLYPQFASHNAHTLAGVLELAQQEAQDRFEFQRLHGMGESLHQLVQAEHDTQHRIYAPVGVHQDLLAYLVRRLLENGANSSFVHQIVDESVPATTVAQDPFEQIPPHGDLHNMKLRRPPELFHDRKNARGFDLHHADDLSAVLAARGERRPLGPAPEVTTPAQLETVVATATHAADSWSRMPAEHRAALLEKGAEGFEARYGELFALLALEANKTLPDAVAELREAVDFLRYYANQARNLEPVGPASMVCISPWNFPLAIFTGQLAAALAAGNTVIAKPSEQTPRIAALAVALLHEAGVPRQALQLAFGPGRTIGAALTTQPTLNGVIFTGSTSTAQLIHRAMAAAMPPTAPLVAETGGINAMIVDSTALPEQAVRDIVASAFQSAGQRCSALRMLYLQEDVADRLIEMIRGAMDALVVGDPWHVDTDVGPLIDADAYRPVAEYLASAAILHQSSIDQPVDNLIPPTLVEVAGIEALEGEVFAPVLHVARFKAKHLDRVIRRINQSGYGLTFGLHSRLDDRVQHIVERVRAGNLYINRNQIGAVVESQPFGGEGLSGTGPKAGGPYYVPNLARRTELSTLTPASRRQISARRIDQAIGRMKTTAADSLPAPAGRTGVSMAPKEMPGPTGERNVLRSWPRSGALCLGPSAQQALEQAHSALSVGCPALICHGEDPEVVEQVNAWRDAGHPVARMNGWPTERALTTARRIEVVAFSGSRDIASALRQTLAAREGPLVRLATQSWDPHAYTIERHVCVDTTAAGGNTRLMSGTE